MPIGINQKGYPGFNEPQIEALEQILNASLPDLSSVTTPAPVTGADILADTPPSNPGTFPNCTVFYISTAASGVDIGTKVVWIPTNHPTLPAAKGWRFEFFPSATVL